MAWCFEDETAPEADLALQVVEGLGGIVPSIWPLEVANVLVVAERRGRIVPADLTRFLTLLQVLPIQVEVEAVDRVWTGILSLAREHSLSTYDAAYLELAARHGAPLLTLDGDLKRVAATLGIRTDALHS